MLPELPHTLSPGLANRRIVYGLAVPQHGVVSRRQIIEGGISWSQVRSWLANGHLLKVFETVYSLGRPAETPESQMMAAVLAGGPTAVLSGMAAAAAWGFEEPSGRIEIVRRWGATRLVRGVPPHKGIDAWVHRGVLREHELCHLGPLPVASPDYVLTSLAGQVSKAALRRHFLDAARFGLLTRERLDWLLASRRKYRGRARLLRLVRLWDPPAGKLRSMLESEFRLMLAEQKVPRPEVNQPIGPWEADALWRQEMLVVELDSRKFHRDLMALEADTDKTRGLRKLGYRVLRFTWEEITCRPEWVAAQLFEALGRSR